MFQKLRKFSSTMPDYGSECDCSRVIATCCSRKQPLALADFKASPCICLLCLKSAAEVPCCGRASAHRVVRCNKQGRRVVFVGSAVHSRASICPVYFFVLCCTFALLLAFALQGPAGCFRSQWLRGSQAKLSPQTHSLAFLTIAALCSSPQIHHTTAASHTNTVFLFF